MEKRRYLTPSQKDAVILRQKGICACGCGEPLDLASVHWDHRLPLWLGGTNDIGNFDALKPRHHIVKTSKEATERAKGDRIIEQGGLLKPKLSKRGRELRRRLDYQASRA